jgi:hypothetical protein
MKHFLMTSLEFFLRHEEDGIQDPSVAREMLRLQRLQERHWNKVSIAA